MKSFNTKDIYEKFFLYSQDLLCLADKEWNFLKLNPEWEKRLGYKQSELEGKSYFDYVHSDDLKRTIATANQLGENTEVNDLINRYRHKDGTYLWFRWRSFLDGDNKYISATDITKDKQTEEDLIQNEAILKATLESIDSGILIVSSEGKVSHNNSRFKELFDLPDDLISTQDDNLMLEYAKNKFSDPDKFLKDVKAIYDSSEVIKDYIEFKNGVILERLSYPLIKNSPVQGRVWIVRDFTEKKQQEESLKTFQASIEHSMEAIYWMDRQGRFIYVNQQACNMLGYSKEELLKLTVYDIDPVIPKSEWDRKWEKHISTGDIMGEEFNAFNKRKDGSSFPVEVFTNYILGEKTVLQIAHVRDVTERKGHEESLLKNQILLNESQRIAQMGSWEMDLISNSVKWSDATYILYGVEKGEDNISIEFFLSIIHPDDREFVSQKMKETLEKGWTKNDEFRVIHSNGKIRNMLASAELFNNNEGKPVKMIGVVQDVTEKKKAEEELRIKQIHLTNAVTMAKIGYWEYDIAKDLFSFNDYFYKVYQTSVEEVGGYEISSAKYTELMMFPDDADMVAQEMKKAQETDDPNFIGYIEHRILFPNGKVGHVAMRFTIIKNSKGETIGIIGTNQDITDRIKHEQAIREKDLLFRSLFQNITSATSIYEVITNATGDPVDYRFVSVNSAYEEVTGLKENKIIRKTLLEVFPHTEKIWLDTLKEVYQSGNPITIENYAQEVNKYFELLVYRPQDGMVAMIGKDVTERRMHDIEIKKAKERAEESELFLKESQEAGAIGSYNTSYTTGYWKSTDTLDKIFGFTVNKDKTFNDWIDAVHPDDKQELMTYYQNEVLGKKQNFNYEYRIIRLSDKKTRWVHGIGKILRDKEGNPLQMFGTMQDITQKKEAELKLVYALEKAEESEMRFRALHNASFGGIVIHDNGVNLDFNEGMVEISGYSKEELIGASTLMFVAEESRDTVLNNIKRGYEEPYEVFGVRKNGEKYPARVEARNMPYKGKMARVVEIRDITEQKRIEEDLRKKQIHLTNAVTMAKIGYWEYDIVKDLFTFNDYFYDVYRTTAEKIGGYQMSSARYTNLMVHPDDAALVAIQTKKAIEINDPDFIGYFEHKIIFPNKGVGYIAVRFSILRNDKGDTVGTIGTNQDITERKKSEWAIREKELLFQSLFVNLTSSSSLYRVKINSEGEPFDYEFIEINPAYEKLTGLKSDQILGKTLLEIFPNTEAVWLDTLKNVYLTGTPVTVENFSKEVNMYFELIVYRPQEGLLAMIGTDITERRLHEIEIRKAKELAEEREFFLQESQRTGNIGSYKMDFETGDWISTKTMDNIFGIDDAYDKDTKGWLDIVHPEDKEIMANYFQNEVIGKQQPFNKEYRIIRKNDDQIRWLHGVGKLYFDNNGTLTHMLGTIQDITERKLIEEERKMMNLELENRVKERTAQLHQANKDLESFAYSVSHDLRAPIRHIDGFMRLMQNAIKPIDEKVEGYFNKIAVSSKNMSTMIDELLQFSRLGRTDLKTRSIDLSNIIEDVITQLKPDYEGRNINWNISKLPMAFGDPGLLKIAFENIISNAIKYTANKEQAIIEIGEKETCQTGSVCIFIKDNGAGFDMDYKEKLFGVFQRLHKSEEFEGTGIGLANVNQIIIKHGGKIDAESEVNKGATFFITLPNTL